MFKSPFPDVEIPEIPAHVGILMRLEEFPERTALVDPYTEKEYTYRQVIDYARNGASGLARRGVRKGDIISFFVPNVPEFSIVLLASLSAGATVSTINPVYTHYELTHHLQDSDAKWLFTTKDQLGKVKKAQQEYSGIKGIITVEKADGCISFDELVHDDGSHYPADLEFEPREDVALIPFSSGTTGLPKGVMLTHYNMIAQLCQFGGEGISGPPEETPTQTVVMGVLPFFHSYGLMLLNMAGLTAGAKIICMKRFEPHAFLAAIQKYKVKFLPIVPPIVLFLAKSELVRQYDLSSVERVNSGAAPIDSSVMDSFQEKSRIERVANGYGMTETTCAASTSGHSNPIRKGAVGFLLPNMEGKFVDPATGKVCGLNERGELWMRGPNIMKGYYKKAEATRQTLDSEGFLHSGDIGYRDEDGYLYIVDRMKELIKFKGFQVAPAELEALLLKHPDVNDVGVVGIKDVEAGELPRAYVVKRPGTNLTKERLQAYVQERVASFKRLRGGVVFVNEIPKSQSGKILRRRLVEMFGNDSKI